MPHREVNAEALRDAAQAVVAEAGQQQLRQVEGVVHGAAEQHAAATQEVDVELDALADHRAVADEVCNLARYGRERWRRLELGRADAGETLHLIRRRMRRPHQRLVLADHAPAIERDRRDLDDLIGIRVQTGGLGIEGDVAGHRASKEAASREASSCKLRASSKAEQMRES